MSIATEISRLQSAKASIKTAIEGKGVTVPSATLLDGYAALISSIPTGGGGTLPYTPLEYLETDGNSYINTGIKSQDPMFCDMKVKINTSISTSEVFAGTGNVDGNANTFVFLLHSVSAPSGFGYGYKYLYSSIFSGLDLTNPVETSTHLISRYVTMGYKLSGASSYVGATPKTNRTENINSTYPIYIFATNGGSSATMKCSAGSRLYYIKIYQGRAFPSLAFDGVPALYNGQYGLWDNVSNSFFGNANSTGSFTGQ